MKSKRLNLLILIILFMGVIFSSCSRVQNPLEPAKVRISASSNTPSANAAQAAKDQLSQAIWITEIMYNPQGRDSLGEFVEIYNSSSKPIDIGGWYITDAASKKYPDTIESAGQGTIIQSGQYAVITDKVTNVQVLGNGLHVTVDDLAIGNGLNNTNSNPIRAEKIILRSDKEQMIDAVYYGDPSTGEWPNAEGNGMSLQRTKLTPAAKNSGRYWIAALANPGLALGVYPLKPPAAVHVTRTISDYNGTDWKYTDLIEWAAAAGTIKGYNVYKNGVKINSEITTTTSYTTISRGAMWYSEISSRGLQNVPQAVYSVTAINEAESESEQSNECMSPISFAFAEMESGYPILITHPTLFNNEYAFVVDDPIYDQFASYTLLYNAANNELSDITVSPAANKNISFIDGYYVWFVSGFPQNVLTDVRIKLTDKFNNSTIYKFKFYPAQ